MFCDSGGACAYCYTDQDRQNCTNYRTSQKRDVTDEVNSALKYQVVLIHIHRAVVEEIGASSISAYIAFYLMVDHGAPWDIKIEDCWEDTIGTTPPQPGEVFLYDGLEMTSENLGNFTYGFLGAAYGFPVEVLFGGSYYAAGFPTEGSALENEVIDEIYVALGYYAYQQVYETSQ